AGQAGEHARRWQPGDGCAASTRDGSQQSGNGCAAIDAATTASSPPAAAQSQQQRAARASPGGSSLAFSIDTEARLPATIAFATMHKQPECEPVGTWPLDDEVIGLRVFGTDEIHELSTHPRVQIIGSSSRCDVVLRTQDGNVAAQHAKLMRHGSRW